MACGLHRLLAMTHATDRVAIAIHSDYGVDVRRFPSERAARRRVASHLRYYRGCGCRVVAHLRGVQWAARYAGMSRDVVEINLD